MSNHLRNLISYLFNCMWETLFDVSAVLCLIYAAYKLGPIAIPGVLCVTAMLSLFRQYQYTEPDEPDEDGADEEPSPLPAAI